MASVDRQPNGRWRAHYRDSQGHSRSQTFDRKLDAQRFLERTGTQLQQREWRDPQLHRITFDGWVEMWWTTLSNIRDSTKQTYEIEVRRHLLPAWSGVPLGRISALGVQQWIAAELDQRSTASTLKSFRMFRMVMRSAVDMGVLARDPCSTVKAPRSVHHEMQFLDPAEIEDLAGAIHPTYRTLIYLLAYGGLRWGEGAGLRRRNLELTTHQLMIIEQLIEVPGGGCRFGPPKSKAGVRRVTLPELVCDLLASQAAERAQPGPDGLVFVNTQGGPLRRSTFRRNAWLPALAATGLGNLRPHDLRHTAVALAIAQGAHPVAIQKRLGHANVATSLGLYGHLFPALDEQIAAGMQATRTRTLTERADRD